MKPKDYPEIVYKYRNWISDFHKNVLLKAQVYLAKPSDFNDPFDCKIAANYFLIEDNEVEDYIANIIQVFFPKLRDINTIIAEKNHLRRQFANRKELQERHQQIEFDGYDSHTGVLSLSKYWDSLLMWSHYADYHKGYCIGFEEEKIREAGFFGRGGPVLYDEHPKIKPDILHKNHMEETFQKTFIKSPEWEYEGEYRLMTTDDSDKLQRTVQLSPDCIVEVVLGICMSDQHKKEIVAFTTTNKIPTYQAVKVPFHFKIERQKIV